MKILLQNAAAILPAGIAENISILIDGEIIAAIGRTIDVRADETIDLTDQTIFPGFIDVHNHGAVGVDVNTATAEDLRKVGKFLASKGVTAWLPTFVPDADEVYRRVVEAINEVMQTQADKPIAQIVGVHYEGAFANEKMCGALRPEFFKSYKSGAAIELPRLTRGVHFTTLAPEVENGIELIGELRKQNWIVSIGHTRAGVEILDRAFAAGARHLTHFFNAMTGLHHRDVGVVGWGLTKKEATFDIIADGVHVHPQMLRFAVETKGAERVSLISDSVAPTALGDGDYQLWGGRVRVADGKTENESGGIAGSVITMLDAVERMRGIEFSDIDVALMASRNPARLLNLDKTRGTIEPGKRADLVALDEQGNVRLTVIGGKVEGMKG